MNERINERPQPQQARQGPRPLPLYPPSGEATSAPLATVRWRVRRRPRAAGGGGRVPQARARAPSGEDRGGARPEAGAPAGCWLGSRRWWWRRLRRRVAGRACAGREKAGGGDAAAFLRSAEEVAALETPESAEQLRAGAGGFGRLPGHGGRGRWLARQRCGPGPCGAGTVAALTPEGPSHRYEAEPLPRPTAAATTGRPPGGWSSAGGGAAPTPALAVAPASAFWAAATGGADRALGARGEGAGKAGWRPGGKGWGAGA